MKYIRTKDRIFEDEYVHIKVDKDGYAIMEYKGEYYDAPEKVKSADTIEELLDELVFDNFYHSRMTPIAMHTKENQEIIKGYLKQNIPCYGAIWTDKGLIYVAKMNDKGELELI